MCVCVWFLSCRNKRFYIRNIGVYIKIYLYMVYPNGKLHTRTYTQTPWLWSISVSLLWFRCRYSYAILPTMPYICIYIYIDELDIYICYYIPFGTLRIRTDTTHTYRYMRIMIIIIIIYTCISRTYNTIYIYWIFLFSTLFIDDFTG